MRRIPFTIERLRLSFTARNKGKSAVRSWQSAVRNKREKMKTAKIYVYDIIGEGALNANDFRLALEEAEAQGAEEFEVHINSLGGDVFQGMTIYNLLKTRNTVCIVDGIAASIASVIAMAGTTKMYKNTMLMIHNVWTLAAGDSREMEKISERLKAVNEIVTQVYVDKTGMSREEIIAMMDKDSFMGAEEALQKKFANEILEINMLDVKEYVGFFYNVIDDQIINHNRDSEMNKALLLFLGLSDKATEAEIQAAIKAAATKYGLAETATLQEILDKAQASAVPADYETLKNENAAFKQAEETRVAAEAEALVNSAIEKGKLLPALKDQTIADAKKNFAAVKADLDKRAENSAVPAPVVVPTGKDFDVNDPNAIANAARAHMAEQKKLGIDISYSQAVNAVLK
jgi:ATP-dependent protease ClpP protease subunit